MSWPRLTFGFSAASALIASCAIPSFDLVTTTSTSAAGGSAGSSTVASVGGSGGCQLATYPAPVDGAPSSPDDPNDLIFAMRSLDFGESEVVKKQVGSQQSYDLDGVCTCHPDQAATACKRPAFANEPVCDGPRGEDNATADLFAAAIDLAGPMNTNLSSTTQSADIETGGWSLLIRVRGYNGQADDAKVSVSIHPSPGFNYDVCLDGQTPNWDGDDPWPVDANSFKSPNPSGAGGQGGGGEGGSGGVDCSGPKDTQGYDLDAPEFVDEGAYVSNGVLVANLPTAPMVFAGNSSYNQLSLTAGFITGELAQDDGKWFLHKGLLVARWTLKEVFRTISSVVSKGKPLCTDDPLYSLLKPAICGRVDMASKLAGPTTECDSLSFGMGFEAEPAQFGVVFASTATPGACPPETDPVLEGCAR